MKSPIQLPPDGIAREDLLEAIAALDAGIEHDFGESTGYDVLYEGRRYPPKAIVGLAARRPLGRPLEPHEFKGGQDTKCFQILEREGFEIVPKVETAESNAPGAEWTDSELRATVRAYLQIRESERDGLAYNKAQMNRELREDALSTRTKGSVEYRMQNISAVLADLGEPWVQGYKPASNVGAHTTQRLIQFLDELNAFDDLAETPTADPTQLEQRTRRLMHRDRLTKPEGNKQPKKLAAVTIQYERSPEVRAFVLIRAKGHCELCGQAAPFMTADGSGYLEVHHIKPLAEDGEDTVENAAALCPNCHRACHYAANKIELLSDLLSRNRA